MKNKFALFSLRPISLGALLLIIVVFCTAFLRNKRRAALKVPANFIVQPINNTAKFVSPFAEVRFYTMKMTKIHADSLRGETNISEFIFQVSNPENTHRRNFELVLWLKTTSGELRGPFPYLLTSIGNPKPNPRKSHIGVYKMSFTEFQNIVEPARQYSHLKFKPERNSNDLYVDYHVFMAQPNGDPYPLVPSPPPPPVKAMQPSPPADL